MREQYEARVITLEAATQRTLLRVEALESRSVPESRDVYVLLLETSLEAMGRADCIATAKVAVGVMES